MSNKMRRIVGMILVIVGIMMTFGSTANAVYNEEENTIDYEFVMSLAALGMKPDIKVDDSGMIWTRTCEISDLVKQQKISAVSVTLTVTELSICGTR